MSKIKEFIKKNKIFSLLIVVAIAIISVGIFAPIIAPYSPFEGNLSDALQPPSSCLLYTSRLLKGKYYQPQL